MLYFYKQHSLVQPEELHLNGDGVYFNIFTEDSRGEDTTGTLKNIGDDTVLYASNSQPPLQVVVCVSPHKGYITARPKGRYRKLCHWSAIKRYSWNLLFLIPQPALLYISALLHL